MESPSRSRRTRFPLRAVADAVRLDAPAKVNLWLRVLAREASGFHTLETLFCALGLADTLEVRRAERGIALEVEGGIDTGPPERNLVVRAAERFFDALGEAPAVQIRLCKRIPSAAGLGGGSSDAAAALRALNALHGEPLSPQALLRMGARLGSDVPFFLCGSPLALAWGRGERLLALPPLPPRPVLVAHPGVAMPTAEAFQRLAERRDPTPEPTGCAFGWDTLSDWSRIAERAENDFEPGADERIPSLATAKRWMRAEGADIVLLAGSGAAMFGVFHGEASRDAAGERLRKAGFACWNTETLTTLPEPVAC